MALALLIAGCYFYRADGRGRAVLLALGGASAAAFLWFHVAVFDGLTPYNVNVVYAGLSSIELVDRHVELGGRVYRLWGLFVDRRFGVGRGRPSCSSRRQAWRRWLFEAGRTGWSWG